VRRGAGAGFRTRELLRDRILSPAPLTRLGCKVYREKPPPPSRAATDPWKGPRASVQLTEVERLLKTASRSHEHRCLVLGRKGLNLRRSLKRKNSSTSPAEVAQPGRAPVSPLVRRSGEGGTHRVTQGHTVHLAPEPSGGRGSELEPTALPGSPALGTSLTVQGVDWRALRVVGKIFSSYLLPIQDAI